MAKTNEGNNSSETPHQLLPFLHKQSQGALTRLYGRPSACLSVFRLLAPLERQIVMNLLWLDSSISVSTMIAWVDKKGRKQYENALSTLARLHIIGNPSQRLNLNPTFKSSFRQVIVGGGTHRSFGVPASDNEEKRSFVNVDILDTYAVERWETILHYMVSSGTGQAPARPSQGVLFLLERSGLMSGSGGTMKITSLGFQFLLHSPHAQLWDLLLQYLAMAEMDLVEVIGFLFMLSTMELGRGYSTENLGETQKAMLEDLRDYGLIWQKKAASRRFYPTRLATTLTSSLPPLPSSDGTGGSSQAQGFIILETNYRVYAYTDNPLQTAVLNLFVTLKYRFPNLVVGSVTRESVKKALSNGITADQIIKYLTTHAHPQMRKNNPLIPVTVQDQIRLWELEKNRLKSQEGFLYTSFASQADYEYVLKYAKQLERRGVEVEGRDSYIRTKFVKKNTKKD
ncbi:transcription factor Tfb2 [Pyrrhoderma noxium]|uniref:RNA polymerase II transcription factor B subunit 2 n=1 Tax=Pyrrhoderma noxium TaxID=2282107 RepID=A0A286U959_9AGAM|nr:transcription factor Tfb2 [Pyrrhoderma noxium]